MQSSLHVKNAFGKNKYANFDRTAEAENSIDRPV